MKEELDNIITTLSEIDDKHFTWNDAKKDVINSLIRFKNKYTVE